jgi:hypothetical protein
MRAKTFLVLLAGLLLAGCVTAQTFTNGIKASQLGTAATFNGTENLFIWQVVSGTNRTAWATLNQVLAPAISANGATSNALNAAGIVTSNRVTVASNFLAQAIGTNAITITGYYAGLSAALNVEDAKVNVTSNSLVTLQQTNQNASSNFLAMAIATNTAAIAAATNNTSASLTNGTATVTVTNVVTPPHNLGTMIFKPGPPNGYTNLDFAGGSLQTVTVGVSSGYIACVYFNPTNVVSGEQITLLVLLNPNNQVQHITSGAAPPGYNLIGSTTFPTPPGIIQNTNVAVYLNWQVIGTNIVFGGNPL